LNPAKPIIPDLRPPVLPYVKYPEDLRRLSIEELDQLCGELRTELWDTITAVGGHLASALGVVELTVALHYVYNTPEDKLIWDVGHQAYIHKILTGRRELLPTIRQYKGLSGFPKRGESEYDVFGAGHASTSISAALGMAVARDVLGEDHSVVAVIGDGGMTGGLAFEALNNAGTSGRNITVVLNDNGMSISPNVGAVAKFLVKAETNPRLSKLKDEVWKMLGGPALERARQQKLSTRRVTEQVWRLFTGPVFERSRLQRIAGKMEAMLKHAISPGMLFEEFGFQYFGPFDGHNVRELIEIFSNVKTAHRHPALIHVVTVKGKGFEASETDPVKYHGIKGTPVPAKIEPKPALEQAAVPTMSYMDIFGRCIVEETARNPKVVVITAAMKEGTGLVPFSIAFPDNFFDVGIAEGHAVTFAAGMAAAGLKPVAAIYSTFLQRAYDHILHDCALQNLPVVFCLDRAGLVGEDGPTHHGNFDLSFLASIPGMVICAPRSGAELRDLIHTGIEYHDGPFAVRYPRDKSPDTMDWNTEPRTIPIGSWEVLREGRDLLVLAVGTMVETARRAIEQNEFDATLVNCRFVKPMDEALLLQLLARHQSVLTLEEGTGDGGFGARVAMFMQEHGLTQRFSSLHVPDEFIEHGSREELLKLCGLSESHVAQAIRILSADGGVRAKHNGMKVVIDPRAGFCGGVRRVVKMAEQHIARTGEPLVSLGDVIHNEAEIGRLKGLGLTGTGHDILDNGANGTHRLLIRAHGEPPETYSKAQKLGIEIIDGTCPVVTRSQKIARSHYLDGEQVVIVGKPFHPETIGIRGHCDNQALVVFEKSDVEKLDPHRKTFVLAQTTVARHWFHERIEWIQQRCADVQVEVENTLCRFVVGRDRDLEKFAREVDVVIMVGGTKSSNTKVLYDVCHTANPRSYQVANESEIEMNWLRPGDAVGVTGSASTPHWLLERVRDYLSQAAGAEISQPKSERPRS
jgi:1-deoxy-D-xylulose-5-phosphate synthase